MAALRPTCRAERGGWAIRSASRLQAQGFESHTQSAQALCSSPQGGNEKTRRSGFLKILAETVSVEHPYEKRRILRRYPPAYPPRTTGVKRLLVNGKVNRQESARQPRTVQNCFVNALLARASHQNRGGKRDVAHFDLVDDILPGVLNWSLPNLGKYKPASASSTTNNEVMPANWVSMQCIQRHLGRLCSLVRHRG